MVHYKEITADWRGPDEHFLSKDVLLPSENLRSDPCQITLTTASHSECFVGYL